MLKKQVTSQKGFIFLNKNLIILLYHFNNVSTKNWHLLRNKLKKLENVNTLVIHNKITDKILNKIQHHRIQVIDNSINSVGKQSLPRTSSSTCYGQAKLAVSKAVVLYNKTKQAKLAIAEEWQEKSTTTSGKKELSLPGQAKLANPSIYNIDQSSDFFSLKNTDKIEALTSWSTNNINKKSNSDQLKNLFQGPTLLIGCNTNDQLHSIYNIVQDFSGIIFIGGLYNNVNISHYTLKKLIKLNDSVKLELIQFLEYKKASFLVLESYLTHCCSNLMQILKKPPSTSWQALLAY